MVGGGITGLAAAARLCDEPRRRRRAVGGRRSAGRQDRHVAVRRARPRRRGRRRLPHAGAARRRVRPQGRARRRTTSRRRPMPRRWCGTTGCTPIPGGIVLGVPASVRPFVTTSLLSWKGKLRAAAEPFLPRTDPDDSIGALVRARFGDRGPRSPGRRPRRQHLRHRHRPRQPRRGAATGAARRRSPQPAARRAAVALDAAHPAVGDRADLQRAAGRNGMRSSTPPASYVDDRGGGASAPVVQRAAIERRRRTDGASTTSASMPSCSPRPRAQPPTC